MHTEVEGSKFLLLKVGWQLLIYHFKMHLTEGTNFAKEQIII